jgi:hypothetical protein
VNEFTRLFADQVLGVLSGFDRLIFRGYLRELSYVKGLFMYLCWRKIRLTDFGRFAHALTEALKDASMAEAKRSGRPVIYLSSSRTNKEETARAIAKRDKITDGLICVLSSVEPCRSYDVGCNPKTNRFELLPRRRKCLFLYHYFIDSVFGFVHARIQTWLPFDIQIYVNGREWLARQMDRRGLGYERRENCFVELENVRRAQRLMSAQLRLNWPKHLDRIAQRLNPRHEELLASDRLHYYWTVYQSEWATDVMFRNPASLAEIYPRLVRHGISAFSSPDVMRFLGGKVHGNFKGEIVSDFKNRPEGVRIKHRVGANSVKLYDKQGSVLRTETTIHDADGIKVYRPKEGDPSGKKEWRPLRRGVADLHRRAEVSQASNERYLSALAVTDTSAALGDLLRGLDRTVTWKRRRVRGLRAWSVGDVALLRAVNRGEFSLNGFRNRDLQTLLFDRPTNDLAVRRRRSARISRQIALLRAHGLVQKVPRSHRYRMTPRGRQIATAILAAHSISLKTVNDLADLAAAA